MRRAWKRIPKEVDPEKLRELQQEPLERGDIPAMLLAALFTLLLPALLILLLLGGIGLLLFTFWA